MSLVPMKKFNTRVVTPHEALMALKPDIFPWESKIITDFGTLLDRLGLLKDGADEAHDK